MKRSRKCPKCSSMEIVRVAGGYGSRENNIVLGLFGSVPIARYICTNCGFTEEWVDSQEDRAELKKKFG